MKGRLILKIAGAMLMARWRQSLVAAAGVTFGVAAFIALLGFMSGLNRMLDGLVLNRVPHIRLYKEIRPDSLQPVKLAAGYREHHTFIHSLKSANARKDLYNSDMILQSLGMDKSVAGFTPRVTSQVFFNYGVLHLNGMINGIDVYQEMRLFGFRDNIVRGAAEDLMFVSNSIILGAALAETLMVSPGDMVVVTTPEGSRYPLRVVGLYQSGITEYDKVQSYASISTVQKIMGKTNGYITDIAVKLHGISQAPELARNFAKLYGVDAEDVQTANAQFETGSRVRTVISYAVGITLLVVAGFGIYNILNMLIYEKMDAIAIMKATGFSGKDVNGIFLTISMSIGLAGGAAGLLTGLALAAGIDSIPFNTSALPTVKTYPVDYDPLLYLIGFSFSLVTTYFAGFFPARKASRIDPVIIIRGK